MPGGAITVLGSPGDSCQCPHWGYVTAGRLTVRFGDREEVLEPGDAFYMPCSRGGGGNGARDVQPAR
jgi:uncharacterized cupin superfamily protein